MTTEIRIDREDFKKRLQGTVSKENGVEIHLSVHPNFIPYFIRGRYNMAADYFEIQFDYLDKEESEIAFKDDKFIIYEGKNTQKISKIQILGYKRKNIGSVELKQSIKSEFAKLSIPPLKDNGKVRGYYLSIGSILEDRFDDLTMSA